ncbi:MAG: FAD-dependent oxidoreductase [Candidatus Acidiferrales bacterium]
MSTSRRDFLKFVVAGSVAAGCPVDLALLAAPEEPEPQIEGDHFEICHEVRDGHTFAKPPVSKRYEVVIVGGGASGLSAAHFLQSHDFLLLEKEPHWGGNATLEESHGQFFCTGSAFDYKGSSSDRLAREIGLMPLPINSPDPTIINGKWVGDTWGAGLDQLPYSATVRDSFKKFRSDMLALAADKNQRQFDTVPLTKYLKAYAPEIKQWWDCYGPSNYGAKAVDTSTMVALIELKDQVDASKNDTRVTLPGGNGVFVQKLSEILLAKFADRMLADATILSVDPQKTEVNVTYIHGGALRTVAAKFVVMGTPKLITSRLVTGLSDDQTDAMRSYRYCPYAVINMIFDKPVYNRAYDTWCPGSTFTDMIVADWVNLAQPDHKQKDSILSFYTPISELDRNKLLKIEGCRKIAANAVRDFHKLLPELSDEPSEVHFYRRGHAIFLSTPGLYSQTIPAANRPLERVVFANTDSIGPESVLTGAVQASRRASQWIENRMAGATLSAANAAAGFAK